jgi:hypothetical protein
VVVDKVVCVLVGYLGMGYVLTCTSGVAYAYAYMHLAMPVCVSLGFDAPGTTVLL